MKVGDKKTVEYVCRARTCVICEAPAEYRLSFLYENARHNPKSTAYGRYGDDITWCSDGEQFACEEHKQEAAQTKNAPEEDMRWCATFPGKGYPHMLLFWDEVNSTTVEAAPV